MSDFPWFQRLFVAFFGLIFLSGAFTIAAKAIREQQPTVDRAIPFMIAVTAGGLFLWLAVYIKGYTRKSMDGTPFLTPPDWAPDAHVYRFRTGFRSLGGVVVDPTAQRIHFCGCHSLGEDATGSGEKWYSCSFEQVRMIDVTANAGDGRLGERVVTVHTGGGRAVFTAPTKFRSRLRDWFPGKMGPDFGTWESIAIASGTALLLYLVVNLAIRRTGLEQVAPELLGRASGVLGLASAAVGFFLVLRWTRRDRT